MNRDTLFPILFSLGLHGLLASFLMLELPQADEERPMVVEVVWEKPQNVCHSEIPKMHVEKPQKSKTVKKVAAPLHKAHYTSSPSMESLPSRNNNERTPHRLVNRRAHKPLPTYPWVCRKRRQEGTVLLKVHTNEEGHVVDVSLHTSSGHSRLDEVALVAVKSWTFTDSRTQKVLSIVFRLKA